MLNAYQIERLQSVLNDFRNNGVKQVSTLEIFEKLFNAPYNTHSVAAIYSDNAELGRELSRLSNQLGITAALPKSEPISFINSDGVLIETYSMLWDL